MQKFLKMILFAGMLGATVTTSAWSRIGHASIARIAENHLTPQARERLTQYLHGRSIVYYASYPDDYKDVHLVDLGFDPVGDPRLIAYPHTYEAEADGTLYPGIERDGKYVKNCVYYLDRICKQLEQPEALTDSARIVSIAFVVHLIGDVHCPMHIRYPDDQTIGKFPILFRGKETTLHAVWDTQVLTTKHPWSYDDIASLLDFYTPEQIEALTEGCLTDWATESARLSHRVHNVRPGDSLEMDFILENKEFTESQIAKAGYRLAKVLNELFGK